MKNITAPITNAEVTAKASSEAPNVFQKFIGQNICFAQR